MIRLKITTVRSLVASQGGPLLGTLVFLALVMTAVAADQARDLIRQGAADMAAQRYTEALKKFQEAARLDPADPEAFFFQGVVLNRQGRHAEALAQLEQSAKHGGKHPDLTFEKGWSLLGLKRWQDASEQLEDYAKAHPGRGQTSEFLGRTNLALGHLGKAESAFNEALRRDADLKPTVQLSLALLEHERYGPEEARQQLEGLLREAPESLVSRALRSRIERLTLRPEKPWQLTLSGGGGYNNNVTGVGQSALLPGEIAGKPSAFARFTLDGSYAWRWSRADSLAVSYSFLSDTYSELPQLDLLDHFWRVDYAHAFGSRVAGSLRLSDEYTLLGGQSFRNQPGVRPALGFRLADWAVSEVAYSFMCPDYYFAAPPIQDRDAQTHTVSFTQYLSPWGERVQLRVGYFHTWNQADGDDFDYQSDGVFGAVRARLFWELEADASYTHTFDRYTNLNSLAGPMGFEFARRDGVDLVTAQLSRPLTKWLRAYARYSFNRVASNVTFFKYDQHIWSGGVIVQF
ncbi:MAG: tetratricopeptide repeat protein [Verrucomicrobia bacterium]|nr:tetratricopeptide repeat protein [Verrucomicrobiota bacterium]